MKNLKPPLEDAPSHTISYAAAHAIVAIGHWGLGLVLEAPALIVSGLLGVLVGLAVAGLISYVRREHRSRSILARKVNRLERLVRRYASQRRDDNSSSQKGRR